MTDIVNALLFRNKTVLLARRSSRRRTYPNCWSFPGGHVEAGETLDDALARELQEEMGLTPLVFRKIGTIIEPNPQINNEVVYHMYAVSAWSGGEGQQHETERNRPLCDLYPQTHDREPVPQETPAPRSRARQSRRGAAGDDRPG